MAPKKTAAYKKKIYFYNDFMKDLHENNMEFKVNADGTFATLIHIPSGKTLTMEYSIKTTIPHLLYNFQKLKNMI